MTREELLEACFGRSDFPPPRRTVELLDEATGAVMSHVDIYLRRVIVRRPPSPGPVSEGATTLSVAAIAQVCTDPAHRGKGYATALLRRAHSEMREHPTVQFAALFGLVEFYSRLGYSHPAGATHPHFLVCALQDERWPDGRVDTLGEW